MLCTSVCVMVMAATMGVVGAAKPSILFLFSDEMDGRILDPDSPQVCRRLAHQCTCCERVNVECACNIAICMSVFCAAVHVANSVAQQLQTEEFDCKLSRVDRSEYVRLAVLVHCTEKREATAKCAKRGIRECSQTHRCACMTLNFTSSFASHM